MLLLLFILVPLLEIYLFIQVGGLIGAFATIIVVVLTAIIGVAMLRVQGLNTLGRFRLVAARGELPALEMLEGLILLLGGVLLLTPGFFTDAVGFLCLLPATRAWIVRYMVGHGVFYGGGFSPRGRRPDVLEGRFRGRDVDD